MSSSSDSSLTSTSPAKPSDLTLTGSDADSDAPKSLTTFDLLAHRAMTYMRLNLGSADLFDTKSSLHRDLSTVLQYALDSRDIQASVFTKPVSMEEELTAMYNAAIIELFALDDDPYFNAKLSDLATKSGIDEETVLSQRAKARTYIGRDEVSEDPFKFHESYDEGSHRVPSADEAAYDSDETVTAEHQQSYQDGDIAEVRGVTLNRFDQSVYNEQPGAL